MVLKQYLIPGGTTLVDHCHKGGRQAGNKSALSYHHGRGVPGYIPQAFCVPIDAADYMKSAAGEPSKSPGASSRQHETCAPPRPSANPAQSNDTFNTGLSLSARALEPLHDRTMYRTQYQESLPAREQPSGDSDGVLEPRPVPSIAYRTTYGSMSVQYSPLLHRQQSAGSVSERPQAVSEEPDCLRPFAPATTSYMHDFRSESGQSRLPTAGPSCSTADLANGTLRFSGHMPGYGGAVPSGGEVQRHAPRLPVDLQLDLGQAPLGRVPGCTKYKPRDLTYARLDPRRGLHGQEDYARPWLGHAVS